jgi:hypothetical protein
MTEQALSFAILATISSTYKEHGISRPVMVPTHCGECGLPLRWEQIESSVGRAERWLAICACGMPWVFLPERPDYEPEDRLAEALLTSSARAEPSSPWIRLYQLSSGYPWWLPWRRRWRGAPGGGNPVTRFVGVPVRQRATVLGTAEAGESKCPAPVVRESAPAPSGS